MILLSEDEIVAYASKDSEYCQLSVDVGMWAIKEQLKKVVEWLEGLSTDGHDKWFFYNRDLAQMIKKEAGISEPCTRCGHEICKCYEKDETN